MNIRTARQIIPFALFLTIYLAALAWFGVNRPMPWGDEAHFHEAIKQFAHHPTLETLRTYNEMSTPLPFVLYALWGKAFGLDLPVLRIGSLVIASLALGLGYWLFRLLLPNRLATLAVVFLAVNPYFAGTSVFVFTDMLATAFLISGAIALIKESGPGLFVSCSGALLSRQYLVFFPLAVMGYCGLRYLFSRHTASLNNLWWTLLSFLPVAGLFLFWGGLSPDCPRRANYLSVGWGWHPQSFFLYTALLFVYALPFSAAVLYNRRQVIRGLWPVAPVCLLYWAAPIGPSPFTLAETDFVTVGILHRLSTRLFPDLVTDGLFFLLFLLGAAVLGVYVHRFVLQLRSRKVTTIDFLILAHVLFLAVMPFSYLWWEKYFLPLLPLSLALAAISGLPVCPNAERAKDPEPP